MRHGNVLECSESSINKKLVEAYAAVKDTKVKKVPPAMPGERWGLRFFRKADLTDLNLLEMIKMNNSQELRVIKFDRRALSSPVNGQKGGRPPIPILDIVEAFTKKYMHQGKLGLRVHKGSWYRYENGKYIQIHKRDVQSEVIALIQDDFRGYIISTSVLRDVMMNLESFKYCALPTDFDVPCGLPSGEPARDWFVMGNCMVNIEELATAKADGSTAYIKNHTPDLFTTIAVPYDFNQAAQCPKWLKYLERVQPDPAVREIIQMMFGLALVPDTRFEVAFCLLGPGGTGKTVCLHVLTQLVGVENVCCIPLSRFGNRFGLHDLSTSLLNIVGDLPTAGEYSSIGAVEGMFKDIVSGGMIPVEKKFQDSYTARAIARNVFASNSLPMFADRTSAIWDRLRIIPFNEMIRGTGEDNKNLKTELVQEELSGIFNWAVKGLAKLRNLRLFPETPYSAAIKAEHREACDQEGSFLKDNYEFDSQNTVGTLQLYAHYKNVMKENGYRVTGMGKLSEAVRRVFPKAVRNKTVLESGKRIHVWHGLKSLQ